MKKLINQTDDILDEMLEGMVAAHPNEIKRLADTNVIVRSNAPIKGKVGLVSGGGSGHRPAHAGYVGHKLLDAAVCGEVFTSPTPDQVYEAIKAVDGGVGVLLIVKNYSGDVMNFDMAADMAKDEGIKVEQVIIRDDVAIANPEDRRGVAGTIFVHKIAGAAAESGKSLKDIAELAQKTADNVFSMGVSLSPSIVPASGKPGFELKEDEMEIGTGIHGEQGIERKTLKPADEIAEELVQNLLKHMDIKNSRIALMINGQGSTPLMELYIMNRKVSEILNEKQAEIKKTFVGEYMTSIEMAGCSVSILKLDDELEYFLH
ncbi:dihydroxyacetone kinase subunit DhaK [Sinobaca sp. H24]|uniref:dihydroxyacetone kinase subunit DhaK n=1 Tax=Sinobaca sp. H24 TaxID=2923376 RepID=UPI002079F612|nr:dihydroxyacetone kinase subunit DhaK [Sinobaca sp. H24]